MENHQALEVRLKAAQKFVHTEITSRKLRRSKLKEELPTIELVAMKDNLHEVERVGLRNLDEMQVIKLERVLDNVEDWMKQMAESSN